jgi:hypothetical protein
MLSVFGSDKNSPRLEGGGGKDGTQMQRQAEAEELLASIENQQVG